jgi:hypothetical protein
VDCPAETVTAFERDTMAQKARTHLWPLVAIMTLLYLAYDAGSQQFVSGSAAFFPGPLRIEYIPDPNDIVNLMQGAPYTVPAGKVLIITDWTVYNAGAQSITAASIAIDNVIVWGSSYEGIIQTQTTSPNIAKAGLSTGGGSLSGTLRSGVRAEAGDLVTLLAPGVSTGMYASGYLADAR